MQRADFWKKHKCGHVFFFFKRPVFFHRFVLTVSFCMVDVFKAFYFCILIYRSSTWNDVILSIVSEKNLTFHDQVAWGFNKPWQSLSSSQKKGWLYTKKWLIILKVWFLFLTDIFILAYSSHKMLFFPTAGVQLSPKFLPDHESKIAPLKFS